MVMKKIWICENEENEARKFLHILKTLPEVKGKIRVFCEERHLQTMAFDIRSLPDLVFMDLAFGDHKGIQAAENIRKKCGSIPLVFMSENPEDIEKIFESEPSYFIHKPVTLEALFAALRWGERHLPPQDEKAVVVMEKECFTAFHVMNCSMWRATNELRLLWEKRSDVPFILSWMIWSRCSRQTF